MSVLFMTGCAGSMSWVAWRGYDDPVKSPPPGSYENIAGECFKVGTQNLNNEQRTAILEAASSVCSAIKSEEFKNRVQSLEWLASCDLKSNGKPDTLQGLEVFKIINTGIPDFSVNPKYPWMAIAQAQKSENRMAIKPPRINGWYSSNKGALINTIAHESTHLISYSFKDRGHGSDSCPDSKLVSYGIGNLIEELALK